MGITSFLRRWILGSSIPNEYVCVDSGSLSDPLGVFLMGQKENVDVTSVHILLSYQPLIIGLPVSMPDLSSRISRHGEVKLSFRDADGTEVAWIELKKRSEWRMGEVNFFVFEGIRGEHKFLSSTHQFLQRVHDRLRTRSGSLPPALYDQVRIAYSIPRKISVVSVGEGGLYNFFPTDLHGSAGDLFYSSALRISGKACEQLQRSGKLVLSDVPADVYKEVYSLGKNHMQELRELKSFPGVSGRSEKLELPIPDYAISYRELALKNSHDIGLHRLHFYEVINTKTIDERKPALHHVHRHYVQWRLNRGLQTQYFLR